MLKKIAWMKEPILIALFSCAIALFIGLVVYEINGSGEVWGEILDHKVINWHALWTSLGFI